MSEEQRKKALITGAGSGLGRSIALAFADNGYDLILSGRHKGNLKRMKALALEHGAKSTIVEGDITLSETLDSLAEAARENGVDVLVNNAAIYDERPLERMSAEAVRRLIATNLTAPILLTQKLWVLLKGSHGMIININSLAGKEAGENETIYAATKHGLRGFSRSLQFEATEHGVRVIEIYFGAIKTPMSRHRQSFELFIDTDEAAEIIYSLSVDRESARLKEIEIGRKKY